MELAKRPNEHYADLVQLGGLNNALQQALKSTGSQVEVAKPEAPISPFSYARVESGSRFAQVAIAAHERLFLVSFWRLGVQLAKGQTAELPLLAQAIDVWMRTECKAQELAGAHSFVQPEPKAEIYERGDEVEERWLELLSSPWRLDPEHAGFAAAAANEPKLRMLFPFTSLQYFCFSRCTGYPFTRDTPRVLPREKGGYEVFGCNGKLLGSGNATEAAAMCAAAIPPDWGPAVPSTADQFDNS